MYKTKLNKYKTQLAITRVEELFKENLSNELDVTLVKGPLFVETSTGFNDDLSGVESPLTFKYKDSELSIVQSLAKWKRFALSEFEIPVGKGLFAEMNAVRPDENSLTPYHSLHVDQYDWEKHINTDHRTIDFLKEEVSKIWRAIYLTKNVIKNEYNELNEVLAENITFISSKELLEKYPNLSPEEREYEFAKIHKTIFIYGIGHELEDGAPHGVRAPDYDDWEINGDLIVWHESRQKSLELSSMGVRVDKASLKSQMDKVGNTKYLAFHTSIEEDKIPLSIGGGIGKSRINLFLLEKFHIGEVQTTYWTKEQLEKYESMGIELLR